jgi:hypothetical protein
MWVYPQQKLKKMFDNLFDPRLTQWWEVIDEDRYTGANVKHLE